MLGLIIGVFLIVGAVVFYTLSTGEKHQAEVTRPPKYMTIVIDASSKIDDIETIRNQIDHYAVPLLRYHFKDVSSNIELCFVKIDVNVENILDVTMDYWDVYSYFKDLINIIMTQQGLDLPVTIENKF